MSEKTVKYSKYSKAIKAIKAAEIMKKYCASYDHCRDCIFDNGISCEVGNHSSPQGIGFVNVRTASYM
jgi:hypothetical protein